jgi:hypothetical protein
LIEVVVEVGEDLAVARGDLGGEGEKNEVNVILIQGETDANGVETTTGFVSQASGGVNCGVKTVGLERRVVFTVVLKQRIHLVVGDHRTPKSTFFSHGGAGPLPAYGSEEEQVGPPEPKSEIFEYSLHSVRLASWGFRSAIEVEILFFSESVDHFVCQVLDEIESTAALSLEVCDSLLQRIGRSVLWSRRTLLWRALDFCRAFPSSHPVQHHLLSGTGCNLLGVVDSVRRRGASALDMESLVRVEGCVFWTCGVEVFAHDNRLVDGHGSRAECLEGPGSGLSLEGFAAPGHIHAP